MTQQYDLPDQERIEEINLLINDLNSALECAPKDKDSNEQANGDIAIAREHLQEAIYTLETEKEEMAMWDDPLVEQLVCENISDADFENSMGHVVAVFTVGPFDNETELRYEASVTGSNAWLSVRQGNDWQEVWST